MKLKLVLLVAVLAIVSVGCLRTEIDIEVGDDGSVDYGGVFAVDPEAIGQLDELFGEIDGGGEGIPGRDEICAEFVTEQGLDEMPSAEGIDANVEPYDEDGFCGVRFRVSADAAAADEALAGIGGGEDLILREEPGGGWYFELPLGDLSDAGDVSSFPGLDGFFDDAAFVVRVKLPGTQVDHNADAIATDGTMIWNVDLLNPPGSSLFVQTEPGDPITGDADPEAGGVADADDDGSNTLLIVLLVVLALVAVAAAIWWFTRRKSSGADTAGDQTVGIGAAGIGGSSAAGAEWGTGAPSSPPDPTQPFGVPTAAPGPEPAPTTPQPDQAEQPAVVASPTPEQATGQSVWDPVRRAYVQWDATAGHWLVFDDGTQQWRTEA